jgi:hypothetical protein
MDLNNRILNKDSYLSDWADGLHWRVLAGIGKTAPWLHFVVFTSLLFYITCTLFALCFTLQLQYLHF